MSELSEGDGEDGAVNAPDTGKTGAMSAPDKGKTFLVVGMGASAGGVKALLTFFEKMPADSGMAFVVIMHLSPDYPSNLASILQTRTAMPVVQVTEAVRLAPNSLFVIPPGKHLILEEETLKLAEPQQAPGARLAVDLFFRALAANFGQRAVSIVLSGSNSDGAIGIKHIKEQGGLTIAQDPLEAEYDGMPRSALETGMVDWVLTVEQMADRLMRLARNEPRIHVPPELLSADESSADENAQAGGPLLVRQLESATDESALAEVLRFVRGQTGHDFSYYKRATILRRVARRLQVNLLEDIPSYLDFLRTHPAEVTALLHDLLINVTNFFRDREAFQSLQKHIPQLFAGKGSGDCVRVWCAGCATGEEAYSLAMLLLEHAAKLDAPPAIQVFATDIDEDVIQIARSGVYPLTIEADVSAERLRRFFQRDQGRYRIRKEVRELILFSPHDVLRDSPFSRLDLVTCRNLLIYLKRQAQEQVFDVFHFSLRSGGLLFLGSSESVDDSHLLFAPLDKRCRVYVRRAAPRPAWQIPRLPIEGIASRVMASPVIPRLMPPAHPLPALPAPENAEPSVSLTPLSPGERRPLVFGEIHLQMLEHYAPPSLIINENQDIAHLSEHAGRFLQIAGGEPSMNLLKAVHPDLRIELRTALFRAAQSGEPVSTAPLRVGLTDEPALIILRVTPMRAAEMAQTFTLIVFEPASAFGPLPAPGLLADTSLAHQLEEEISQLKEHLSATVEQYEASGEELKASNEELQAMNEELRSASEELETSKEELQSINEELTTVNHELKSNVEEAGRANSDLQNLMASTDIGTIFLDRQMRIKRFTPRIQELFNVIPTDAGRPLSDITHKLNYEALMEDAENVLRDLRRIEREVRSNGHWFLARLLPYRTLDDRIDGVVLNFVDITERKQNEQARKQSEERLGIAVEAAEMGMWEWRLDANEVYWNRRHFQLFGLPERDEPISSSEFFNHIHPDDRERISAALQNAIAADTTYKAEFRIITAAGETRWMSGYGQVVAKNEGRPTLISGVIFDITERKRAEELIQASEEKYHTLFETMDEGYCIIQMLYDAEGRPDNWRFVEVNPAFEKHSGLPDATGKTIRELAPAIEPKWLEIYGQAAETGESLRLEEDSPALGGRMFDLCAFRVGEPAERKVAVLFTNVTGRKWQERRQEYVLRLNDALRPLSGAGAIQQTASRFIGEYLGVDEAHYAEIEESRNLIHIREDYLRGGGPSLTGTHNLSDFGWSVALSKAGQTIVVADSAADEIVPDADRGAMAAVRAAAMVMVPLVKNGVWVAALVAAQAVPRVWLPEEVNLVEETAERTWAAVERARAEEYLRDSETRLQTIANLVPDLLWSSEPSGATLWYSQRWMDYTGQTLEQSLGWGWVDAIHPEDRADSKQRYDAAVAELRPAQQEHRIRGRDGAYRWFLVRAEPLMDGGGHLLRMYGAATDIHEQRAALKDAQESAEQLRALIENLPGGAAFIVDRDLRYLMAAGEAMRATGFTAGSFEGKTLWEALPPDTAEDYAALYRKALAGESFQKEHDIEGRAYLSRGTPLRQEDGTIYAVLAVSYDVTERKGLEEERRRFEQEAAILAERNRMAQELHDTLAQGYTGVKLQADAAEMAINDGSAQIMPYLTRIREIAQGSMQEARQAIQALRAPLLFGGNLPAALQRLAEEVSDGVQVTFERRGAARPLPDAVASDLYRIGQEAVVNALRHAAAERITVQLEFLKSAVCLRISDDGQGFDTRAVTAGYGLKGMQERAERLNARFDLRSAAAQGTEIALTVPA